MRASRVVAVMSDDMEHVAKLAYIENPSWVLEDAFRQVRASEAAKWQAEVNELRSELHALKEGKL